MPEHDVVKEQHALINNMLANQEDYELNTHPDTKWWNETYVGLFIHWGISAVCGMNDLSWGMMKPRPGVFMLSEEKWGLPAHTSSQTPRAYWEQAKDFTAANYDPDKWIAAAKEAGLQYAIMTTKHHDGFALWPSEYGDFNTKNYLGGRDLVGEYIDACRRHGFKVGLYYSPPDWRVEQDYMSFCRVEDVGIDYEPRTHKEKTPEFIEAEQKYRRGQITELLTRYGKIDMFWFDGSCDMAITPEEVRALQPGILCNDRGWGYGDFTCPECKFPAERPAGKFQYIHCLSDGGWGYNDYEIYRPAGFMIDEMCKARSWGGHFVMNVGPREDGTLPDIYYYRMKQIGAWMDRYSGVVAADVGPGPWPEQSPEPVTVKDGVWNLLAGWRRDCPIEITDVDKPQAVEMYDGTPLAFTYADRKLTIDIPWNLKHNYTDPVRIKF